MAPALREYNGELRRYIAASMEVLTRKIAAETKPASATEPPAVVATPDPVPEPSRWPLIATVAALTFYDMGKAVSHGMVIKDVRLLEKTGGRSDYRAQ